jgi:hypothetical protein
VANWEEIITAIMPPEELQRIFEETLDQLFAFLNGQNVTVSLLMSGVKERIRGEEGLNALLEIINAQPPCRQDEILALERLVEGYSGQVTLCRPPDDLLIRMTPLLQNQLRQIADQIPDRADILRANVAANGPAGSVRVGFRRLRLGMRLSPDLALFFLFFLTLLKVRTPRSWMRWWGIPVFLAGIAALILAVMLSAIFEQTWLSLLTGSLPPYLSLGVVELGHDFIGSLIHTLLEEIARGGIILGALGLAAWIGSYFVRLDEEELIFASPAKKQTSNPPP